MAESKLIELEDMWRLQKKNSSSTGTESDSTKRKGGGGRLLSEAAERMLSDDAASRARSGQPVLEEADGGTNEEEDEGSMTWRLESASLPRLSGLPSKAEPLSMLLLPSGGGSGGGGKEGFGGTSVLILYEGGALASYNLTSALVPSAEYAAGGTTSTSTITHRSSLSIALMTVAIVALVIGISMLFVGLRLGLTGDGQPRIPTPMVGTPLLPSLNGRADAHTRRSASYAHIPEAA